MEMVVSVLMVSGLFFMSVAAIGMIRLPDVFARAHAVGLTDTLGAFCLLTGLALYEGWSAHTLRILIVLLLLYVINPVIAHATIRAAHRSGLRPWMKEPS
ncbi:MAG: monovalent cation/H(+) antiporter subunit G [Nitrospirae bacterium]|nr:MAG: monovalent cation/H(+) antiporter subunit G [Nitrospirota bacterium]